MLLQLQPNNEVIGISNGRAARLVALSFQNGKPLTQQLDRLSNTVKTINMSARDFTITAAADREALTDLATKLTDARTITVLCTACAALDSRETPAVELHLNSRSVHGLCQRCAPLAKGAR